ncbi:retron Ec78 anti-phage system effector HNH endonuclease PtuB [Aeromonas hydrophila]|uniref:retron Ec78 anti-phage system effector HNH endonuclease PtuB n=1 Tax=Aeromonas hydrophila TaxID=644 RepID=UPI0035B859CD
MKKLTRAPLIPDVLSQYDPSTVSWSINSPDSHSRAIIWQAIDNMQNGFCCYCEKSLSHNDKHIEHFFHKGKNDHGVAPFKNMTFQWSNLFGSCGKTSGVTCGHYKDRKGPLGPGNYDPNDLIKPDICDSSPFFIFLRTGHIDIKSGLSNNDQKRAEETLRVLNLRHSSLNGAREKQISIFKHELDTIIKLDIPEQAMLDAIYKMRTKVRESEFQSAVISYLSL